MLFVIHVGGWFSKMAAHVAAICPTPVEPSMVTDVTLPYIPPDAEAVTFARGPTKLTLCGKKQEYG